MTWPAIKVIGLAGIGETIGIEFQGLICVNERDIRKTAIGVTAQAKGFTGTGGVPCQGANTTSESITITQA